MTKRLSNRIHEGRLRFLDLKAGSQMQSRQQDCLVIARGWAKHGALACAKATFRVGRRAGTKKWTCLEAGPKTQGLLSGSLRLDCLLRFWLCGFSRFLLRSEFLFDLEGYGIGIDAVGLGGCSENFTAVRL